MMIEQALNHSNCCIQGAKISFLVHNESWSKQRDFANCSRCQLLYNQDKFTILPDMEYKFCKINLCVIRQNMYLLFKTGLLKWSRLHKNAYLCQKWIPSLLASSIMQRGGGPKLIPSSKVLRTDTRDLIIHWDWQFPEHFTLSLHLNAYICQFVVQIQQIYTKGSLGFRRKMKIKPTFSAKLVLVNVQNEMSPINFLFVKYNEPLTVQWMCMFDVYIHMSKVVYLRSA